MIDAMRLFGYKEPILEVTEMKNFAFFMSCLVSLIASANPEQEIVVCSNDHYRLVLRETAVVTYRTATLSFSGRDLGLKCQGEIEPKSQNLSFMCQEDRSGDGRYLAGVVFTGERGTAQIVHEQAYPLAPKVLANLDCSTQNESH